MMRRYEDAIRSFVNVLLYVQRAKQIIQTKSYQFEQVRCFIIIIHKRTVGGGGVINPKISPKTCNYVLII